MPGHIERGTTRRRFRSLFVSDVHLGCRYSQAEKFLAFLESVQPERLYIVGDFIDGWRLKRRWLWRAAYVRILQRLVQLAAEGTQVFYTPGNHDEFLRDFLHDFGMIHVADQFIHRTADGKRFVVLHGDQFDDVERRAKWLSMLGAVAYDGLVSVNALVNFVRRRFRLRDCRFSSHVKVWAKQAAQFISDFEERLICHAKDSHCQGVICGHIHVQRLDILDSMAYCNTGDWVEHCSALVEHPSGKLELLEWSTEWPKSTEPERPINLSGENWEIDTAPCDDCESAAEPVSVALATQSLQTQNSTLISRPASLAGLLR